MSPPEVRLWLRFKGRIPGRPVIHRQHPMGPYILDFYCRELKLAIEVDGYVHTLPAQAAHDRRRDDWLRTQGVEVLAIAAAEVMRDPDGMADVVWREVMQRAEALSVPFGDTSPAGGRGD